LRKLLSATYDLMLEYSRAASLEDVHRVTLARVARFGATSLLAGIVPDHIVRPEDQHRYIVLGHWPMEWAQRYFERQYVRRDPTIFHAANGTAPLLWGDIDFERHAPAARRIMDEATEFRLRDGLTIPQLTIDGLRMGVSISGDRLDRSREALVHFVAISSYAVSRALEIRASTEAAPVELGSREREALRWASEGKSAADTADIMKISVRTVERHLLSARDRLQA
jgi:LuxR family quorum sensing-dependent transcriptional regulator